MKVVYAVFCGILLLGVGVGQVFSAPVDLPPRPTPPKPVVSEVPNGGKIMLQADFADDWPEAGLNWQDLYTVVQWQDEFGDWHDVKGWQGSLDEVSSKEGQVEGVKTWWVPALLFGSEMFRWQVYTEYGGSLMAQSVTFDLPEQKGQIVVVGVVLVP